MKKTQTDPSILSKEMQGQACLTLSQMIAEIAVTHNDNGGCTYDIWTGEQPTKGYAVALFGYERRIKREKLTFDDIAKYLKEHIYQMLIEQSAIGTWYDKETGYTYIDTVVVLSKKYDALEVGKYNAQKYVYDLSKCVNIAIV